MGALTWIAVGLVAGFLAKFVMKGGPGGIGPIGLIWTAVLGVAGALIGGFISTRLGYGDVTGFDLRSVLIATAGAVLVIFIAKAVGPR
ncbi:MAG: GlsB/YeaQ/YmgE family stress response membrane protein [Chloroflexi bacterium]|nr:GlsB/YeaQ/YmgE family stress response membrane protein [Chloroflexota bacterium]MDA1240127.1 GlsB/YeaQ/YmgE family stress response membrane protein [Chloroflexota bacterium]